MSWVGCRLVAPRTWRNDEVEFLVQLGRHRVFPFEAELRDLEAASRTVDAFSLRGHTHTVPAPDQTPINDDRYDIYEDSALSLRSFRSEVRIL
jgi:hypothetical protein